MLWKEHILIWLRRWQASFYLTLLRNNKHSKGKTWKRDCWRLVKLFEEREYHEEHDSVGWVMKAAVGCRLSWEDLFNKPHCRTSRTDPLFRSDTASPARQAQALKTRWSPRPPAKNKLAFISAYSPLCCETYKSVIYHYWILGCTIVLKT